MKGYIMYCTTCLKIVDENWDRRCSKPSDSTGLHWYFSYKIEDIPADSKYDFLRDYLRAHAPALQQKLF